MVFVWAKQETVLAVLKKCPRCLVYVRHNANVFSVGPCLNFINREDRRYEKKNDIRKRECHFYGFWVANQVFWRGLVQERNDLFCQFFDAFSAVVNKNEAPLGPPMEGG